MRHWKKELQDATGNRNVRDQRPWTQKMAEVKGGQKAKRMGGRNL